MPKTLAKIGRIFAMEWERTLQYRTDALLWMLAEAAVPLVSLAIWYAVATSSPAGLAPRDVLTYYVIIIFVKIAVDAWNGFFLAQEILNGEVVTKLIRPFGLVIWYGIVNNITEKIVKLIIPVLFLIGLLGFSPDVFSPIIYQSSRLVLFALSLLLATVLAFLVDFTIGTMAFWLEDVFQIRRYEMLLYSVASGLLIPFAFMPPLAVKILGFLPFRYLISAPAEILLGQPVGITVSSLLAIQAAWIIALAILARILWIKGLQRYAIPGQ